MAKNKLYPTEFMNKATPILLSIGKVCSQTNTGDSMAAVNEAKASLVMIEAAAAQLRELVDNSNVESGSTLL